MHLRGSVRWSVCVCVSEQICVNLILVGVLSGSLVSVSSDLWGLFRMFLFYVFSPAPWRVPSTRLSRANRSSLSIFHLALGGSSITTSRVPQCI